MHAAPHGGPYLALHPPTGRRAAGCYQLRGGLLPHRFALTAVARGGLFSVALWSALAEGRPALRRLVGVRVPGLSSTISRRDDPDAA
jgi:hypothetical protein